MEVAYAIYILVTGFQAFQLVKSIPGNVTLACNELNVQLPVSLYNATT